MNWTMTAAISAALCVTGAAAGQADGDTWRDRFDPERYAGGELYLGLFYEGERDGSMRYGWRVEGDTLHLYDRTLWASRDIYETFEAQMSAVDLAPDSLAIRFHQQDAIMHVEAAFEPGRVSGARWIERPFQDDQSLPLDMELPDAAIIRGATFMMAGVMPMEVGDSVSYAWFAPLGAETSQVTLEAVETVTIETPAGSFDAVRLELRGGSTDNDLFVDRESGRVVRIDVIGQPMQFLAVPREAPQG